MQPDNDLKKILLNGSTPASNNFTAVVMNRVHNLALAKPGFEPLVSPQIKRIFIITFMVLAISGLLLSLVTGSTIPDFIYRINVARWSLYPGNRILTFILCFWMVFLINFFVKKRRHATNG